MISEIKFNGYRFFSNDSEISFVADRRTKKLLSNSVLIDNRQVLKSVAIYGGNNSGKTNLIILMKKIKMILSGKENVVFNSRIFNDSAVIDLSITFNNRDGLGWFKYEFEYDNYRKEFLKEKFSKITYYDVGYPNENVVLELDRTGKKLLVYDQDKSSLLNVIIGQKPFVLSVRIEDGEFSSLKEFKDSIEKLANSLTIIDLNNFPFDNTLETFKSGTIEKQKFITSFVKHADLSITNFSYFQTQLTPDNEKISEKALRDFEKVTDAFKMVTTYNKTIVPSMIFDSAGTKKIEAIASYIYDALSEGNTLVIDEMDNGLHFKLSRAIVSLFNNIANKKAQLLFTAHDLLLVDCGNLMRKEQIYFVERTKEKAKLYCLSSSTVANGGIREGDELIKRYYKGDFGYVPSPSFIGELLSLSK